MASHELANLYADQVADSIWLELGAGHSTVFFQNLASKHNASFISVDIGTVDIVDNPAVIQADGVEFCNSYNFQNRLGLVYLDNFDWLWQPQQYRDDAINHQFAYQIGQYRSCGVEMHNINSSITHLNQIKSLDNAWANCAVVIMDDTWFDHKNDVFCGKGNAAIYHLLTLGWQVLNGEYSETYVVMGKNINPTGTLFDIDALNKSHGIVWRRPG
jgi:hypothetical protein